MTNGSIYHESQISSVSCRDCQTKDFLKWHLLNHPILSFYQAESSPQCLVPFRLAGGSVCRVKICSGPRSGPSGRHSRCRLICRGDKKAHSNLSGGMHPQTLRPLSAFTSTQPVTALARMDTLKETCALLLALRLLKQWFSRNWNSPRVTRARRRKRLKCISQKRNLWEIREDRSQMGGDHTT